MKIKVPLSIKVLGLNSQKFQWEQRNQLNNHDYQTKRIFFHKKIYSCVYGELIGTRKENICLKKHIMACNYFTR